MKKLAASLLLAGATLAHGVGFPIFIGNTGAYLTNTGSGVVLIISNFPISALAIGAVIQFQPVTIANTLDVSGVTTVGALRGNGITANGFSLNVTNIGGVGGANTNFTLNVKQGLQYLDGGTTNVNIVAIMGWEATRAWEGAFVVTNRTGTDRKLSFGTISNSWTSVTHYDGVSTNGETLTITNSTAISIWYRILGSNILYAAKHISLPP